MMGDGNDTDYQWNACVRRGEMAKRRRGKYNGYAMVAWAMSPAVVLPVF